KRDLIFLPLQASWLLIKHNEGENDGLVSVKSQQWEPELIGSKGKRKKVAQKKFSVPADHLNEVGWWDPQETNPVIALVKPDKQAEKYESKIRGVYLEIARNL